jgi:PIN domain nuclease of toxin-antitoxin system
MKYLLDTHVLLWAAGQPERLSESVHGLLQDRQNQLYFSSVSIWEIVIKRSLGRNDFVVDPRLLRYGLINNGYVELTMTSEHALTLATLPSLHKDPFDRILVAQAITEPMKLITADAILAQYSDLVMFI